MAEFKFDFFSWCKKNVPNVKMFVAHFFLASMLQFISWRWSQLIAVIVVLSFCTQ
jgi:hypothetical protein